MEMKKLKVNNEWINISSHKNKSTFVNIHQVEGLKIGKKQKYRNEDGSEFEALTIQGYSKGNFFDVTLYLGEEDGE